MEPPEINTLIEQALPNSSVEVSGDGYHFDIKVVSPSFKELSTLKRQQIVYGPLNPFIQQGIIHAVNITTALPEDNNHG